MTSFCLKLIALFAMTLDHAAKIIGQSGLLAVFPDMSLLASSRILGFMEDVGRLAFPLFAFVLTEGAEKTRSMTKYIGRLILFAVISEPFYYLAFSIGPPTAGGFLHGLSQLQWTNVFVTLALGLTAISCYQLLKRWKKGLVFVPVCLLFFYIAEWVGCDYGMSGVFLIVFLYLAKTKRQKSAVLVLWSLGLYVLGQVLHGAAVTFFDWVNCAFAAGSCVFLWWYNGHRGRPLKWSFYLYYPAHLVLLTLLAWTIR